MKVYFQLYARMNYFKFRINNNNKSITPLCSSDFENIDFFTFTFMVKILFKYSSICSTLRHESFFG